MRLSRGGRLDRRLRGSMLLIQLVLIVIDRPPFYQFIENFGNMGTHDRFCEMLIIEISIYDR
jgi:hypothetical protein